VKIADSKRRFQLAEIIPVAFGGWTIDTSIIPLQVDPETQARLDKIYNQTLSRTYIDPQGNRVMLSIAYGGDQSSNMAVHLPGVLRRAGLRSAEIGPRQIRTAYGAVPVKHLYAINGPRQEPITYWITVGDKALTPGMDQRMQELRYGLTGAIPDAMLVRVSTIDSDTGAAYAVQEDFVRAMAGMKPQGPRAHHRQFSRLSQHRCAICRRTHPEILSIGTAINTSPQRLDFPAPHPAMPASADIKTRAVSAVKWAALGTVTRFVLQMGADRAGPLAGAGNLWPVCHGIAGHDPEHLWPILVLPGAWCKIRNCMTTISALPLRGKSCPAALPCWACICWRPGSPPISRSRVWNRSSAG
jgi:EpsI family protein